VEAEAEEVVGFLLAFWMVRAMGRVVVLSLRWTAVQDTWICLASTDSCMMGMGHAI
jgi:hypothetical protein